MPMWEAVSNPLPSSARPRSSASASTPTPLSTATVSTTCAVFLLLSFIHCLLRTRLRAAWFTVVDDQLCKINGQFGKKATTNGKFHRCIVPSPVLHRTRTQQAEGRPEAQREAEASASVPTTTENGLSIAVKGKRDLEHHAVEADGVETSAKRSRVLSSGAPTQYFTPNPMSFTRKK
jgi:hypothetical protein